MEIRPLDLEPRGLAHAAALLRIAFPKARHFTEPYLAWLYASNPAGRALGFDAWEGNQLISHCAVAPLRARLFGKEVRGVLSLNAATRPEHQRGGLYFDLARRTYALAREQGFRFGVAVTNRRSTPGFVEQVGFALLRPLEARLGVGPVARAARRRGVDFERLWDAESLAWRLACPAARYRLARRAGRVEVRGPSGRPGVEVWMGEVDEALAPEAPAARASLASPLRLWVGLDPAIAWSRCWYAPLPVALRPSPLNLIFLDLSGAGRMPEARRVHWRALDFDDF